MNIILLSPDAPHLDAGIRYFHDCWGDADNFAFYDDCIRHSLGANISLPAFYVALSQNRIIGSYALLTNDIISRQDLLPWLGCLHVEEEMRGKGLAGQLLAHGLGEAARRGYDRLYLSTDIEGFYEKKGWSFMTTAYGVTGNPYRVYEKNTADPA